MDEKTTPEIRTFRLELSFDGTEYHGWQRQPNGITVQEVLEERDVLYREVAHIIIDATNEPSQVISEIRSALAQTINC